MTEKLDYYDIDGTGITGVQNELAEDLNKLRLG